MSFGAQSAVHRSGFFRSRTALATGLLFARFTRPTAAVLFSRQAVITPYNDGQALMCPPAVGDTAVTLIATAETPVAGMPPCPVSWTSITPFAGTGPFAP